MKLKDILFDIYISIFGDKNKKKFMYELIKITDKDIRYSSLIKIKSEGSSAYLEELYHYWSNNGNLEIKLQHDLVELSNE